MFETVTDQILFEFVRTGYSYKHPRIKAFFESSRQSLLGMDLSFAQALLKRLQDQPDPTASELQQRREECNGV